MSSISIETAGRIIGSMHNPKFECPHCATEYDGSESETAQHVVSLWGDGDAHDFCCDHCGKDFVVRETVMRSFEAARSHDDLD